MIYRVIDSVNVRNRKEVIKINVYLYWTFISVHILNSCQRLEQLIDNQIWSVSYKTMPLGNYKST